jgi:shikimate dehydrogenase
LNLTPSQKTWEITSETKVCALIGDPVAHSLSPTIHNAAFKALGLNYAYVAFRVVDEELKDAISGCRSLGFIGFNVTMPHKTRVAPFLDVVDAAAQKIGAVNTVLNKGGELKGYNTDGLGALQALKEQGVSLDGTKVVLLGAGGAARAISYHIAGEVGELVILNRTERRATELAEELARHLGNKIVGGHLRSDIARREICEADVLINATPVGMNPLSRSTPIDLRLIRPDLVVFDTVYDPPDTELLRRASAVGAKAISGICMLIHQGASSFKIWTGREAPLDLMRRAALQALEGKR